MLSEWKTLTQAERRSDEGVEPHLPRDHHRWTIPVEVVLAVVLTVPGPSTLAAADIATRKRPPRPRTRRNAVTMPVNKPSLSSRSAPDHRRLYDQLDEIDVPGWKRVQPGATSTMLALGQLLNAVSLAPVDRAPSGRLLAGNEQRKYRDLNIMTDTTLAGGEHRDGEGGPSL